MFNSLGVISFAQCVESVKWLLHILKTWLHSKHNTTSTTTPWPLHTMLHYVWMGHQEDSALTVQYTRPYTGLLASKLSRNCMCFVCVCANLKVCAKCGTKCFDHTSILWVKWIASCKQMSSSQGWLIGRCVTLHPEPAYNNSESFIITDIQNHSH